MVDQLAGLWEAIHDDRKETARIDNRTSVHEAVCAERYRAINLKMNIGLLCLGLLMADTQFDLHGIFTRLLLALIK